jgi:hypothetical protein
MCSVTIHRKQPLRGKACPRYTHIITMNRDETLTRGAETPPCIWKNGALIAPTDPTSNGTWIGARKDGIWACLLNGYLSDAACIDTPQSRGAIIPDILSDPQPEQAFLKRDLRRHRAFRLLIGNAQTITEYFWDGQLLSQKTMPDDDWLFITSSSLKQKQVKAYRQAAFETWRDDGATIKANGIPDIHLYQEKNNLEFGILMQRDYAKTKSITQIILQHEQPVQMRYWLADATQNPAHITSWKNK